MSGDENFKLGIEIPAVQRNPRLSQPAQKHMKCGFSACWARNPSNLDGSREEKVFSSSDHAFMVLLVVNDQGTVI